MDAQSISVEAWPRFTPVADHALLVAFGDAITDEVSAAVVGLDRALAADPPPGMTECVPAMVNILIDFDPVRTDHEQVRAHVERLLHTPHVATSPGQLREVEVCYDDALAPDLQVVAQAVGLSPDEVIRQHLQGEYQVRMYGFAPGYAYLSGVPRAIQVPRKPTAIRNIPAGSVLIAGPQCIVSTLTMPTGWSIIGRSPTKILLPAADHPFLFEVGDTVRFRQIDRAQYEARLTSERTTSARDG